MSKNDIEMEADSLIDERPDGSRVAMLDERLGSIPPGARMTEEEAVKPSLLSQPIVAVPVLLVLIVLGAILVSSLEKVPVPPPVTEEENSGPTDFERAQAARRALVELALDASIAYPSVDGFTVFDLEEARQVRVSLEPELTGDGPFQVLATRDRHFVFDASTPEVVVGSRFAGDLVGSTVDGRFVGVGDGDVTGGETRAQFAYVLKGPSLDPENLSVVRVQQIDDDAGYFLAPGLGVVLERDDGGARLYEAGGLRDYSDHRVVAASASARVEVRCAERCSPFYVGPSGESPLPEIFGAIASQIPARPDPSAEAPGMLISPDGQWIVLYNEPSTGSTGPTLPSQGFGAQLYEVDSGDLLPVVAGAPGPPAWSVDSAHFGWLDPTGNDVRLVVVAVGDRSVATIDLDALGVPNRDGDGMVFLP